MATKVPDISTYHISSSQSSFS